MSALRIITVVALSEIAFTILAMCVNPGTVQAKEDPRDRVQVTTHRIMEQKDVPVYRYKIIKKYPHDTTSYTEGLVMSGGSLYEGTGLFTRSTLTKRNLETGAVLEEKVLAPRYFGEGITVLGDEVYELTYLSNTGFVYDKNDLTLKREFQYPAQGWGLTNDGTHLIMSDGSSALIFLDPSTMKVTHYIIAADTVGRVGFLNELEYVDGSIYANVWQTLFIAKISAKSGKITGWIDLSGLNPDPAKLKYPYVLNGIAYDKKTGHLLVTGKCWPYIYEIQLVPVEDR
ncbi:MAG: glutaminyl-peptide cyclotransferase [Deltaproteobacteria bacterium]